MLALMGIRIDRFLRKYRLGYENEPSSNVIISELRLNIKMAYVYHKKVGLNAGLFSLRGWAFSAPHVYCRQYKL